MERKQSIRPEEQLDTSSNRLQMKYFRKVGLGQYPNTKRSGQKKQLKVQRIKRDSLIKLYLNNEGYEYGHDPLDNRTVRLFRDQRSTLKILRKIKIDNPCQLFFQLMSLVRNNFCRLRQFLLMPQRSVTDQDVALFKIIGNNHKQLEHLRLDFGNCSDVTDHGMRSLATQINKHTNLLQLDLNFTCQMNVTNEGVQQIGKNLNKLVSLNICFSDSYALESVLEGLGSQFKYLENLRKLILDFSSYPNIDMAGFYMFASEIGNHLPQLQLLDLNLADRLFIMDEYIEYFANEIGNNQKLVELILNLSSCRCITDASAQALARVFKEKLYRLRRLELKFNFCLEITDEGMIPLINSIATLENLQQFKLDYPKGENLTKKAFLPLANMNMNQFDKLSLNFDQCYALTDQIVEALATTIGKSPNKLRDLELYTPGK